MQHFLSFQMTVQFMLIVTINHLYSIDIFLYLGIEENVVSGYLNKNGIIIFMPKFNGPPKAVRHFLVLKNVLFNVLTNIH
jgi:hypothetical protein